MEPPLPPIAHLGIPTLDRPDLLIRAITSFCGPDAPEPRAEVLVLDSGASNATRERIRREQASFRALLRYAGLPEVNAYLAALAGASNIDVRDLALWLTAERGVFSAGAARSLLLLDAAGRRSLQVDDDIHGPLCAAPDASFEPIQAPAGDPMQVWPTDKAPPGARETALVTAHEPWLGHDPPSILPEPLGAAGPVLVTQLGIRGDPATGALHPLLFHRGPSAERWIGSGADHRAILASRRFTRAAPAPSFGLHEVTMTYAIGLDLREIVPPFPPRLRNEDALFGAALGVCRPGALRAWLPWTVAHDPDPPRATTMDRVLAGAGRTDTNDLIAALLGVCRAEIDTSSPARACATMGEALLRWARAEDRVLFAPLRLRFAARLAERITTIEALRNSPEREGPRWAAWRSDAEQLAFAFRDRLEDPNAALPLTRVAARGRDAAIRAFRDHLRAYAELARAWPRLWDAALGLASRGVHLGEVA